MQEQTEYCNAHKKTHVPEPVIFRNFGRISKTVTYCLPDFLYTYIISGTGTARVENENKSLSTGDSFVIARRQKVSITFQPTEEDEGYFNAISIRISETDIDDYFLHSSIPDKKCTETNDMIQQLSDHPLLHGLSLLLEDGMKQGFRAEWKFTKMKIQECIDILVALDERIYHWFAKHNHWQKIDLRTFMENNFRHNIPLVQLAQATGRSLSTFRRDFIQEFGTTPSRWLIARRLEEAYHLITSGKHPGEILIELGFESFSHFTRCFKQRFGMLPSEALCKQMIRIS